jgi:hypothetical protein
VSESVFERSVMVTAPADVVRRLVWDGEALFRLNPEWEVLAYAGDALRVRYERSEAEADYRVVRADRPGEGASIELVGEPARRIDLTWRADGDGRLRLDYREAFAAPPDMERGAELTMWLRAFAGYLALTAGGGRKPRVMRWLLDRIWLRMTPTSRRVSLLIVGMEALALLLFVAIVLVYRFSG